MRPRRFNEAILRVNLGTLQRRQASTDDTPQQIPAQDTLASHQAFRKTMQGLRREGVVTARDMEALFAIYQKTCKEVRTMHPSDREDPAKRKPPLITGIHLDKEARLLRELTATTPGHRESLFAEDEHPSSDATDTVTTEQPRATAPRLRDLMLAGMNLSQRRAALLQRPAASDDDRPTAVHILGSGPLAMYLAHHISSLPDAPTVTIVLDRLYLMHQWFDEGAAIKCLPSNGDMEISRNIRIESCALYRFHYRSSVAREGLVERPTTMIDCLINTLDLPQAVNALKYVKNRLWSQSTVCFMAHGLAVDDYCNMSLFPEEQYRPHYMLATCSHLLSATKALSSVVERRRGNMHLCMPGSVQQNGAGTMSRSWPSSSRKLLLTLARVPQLRATTVTRKEHLQIQLKRLCVNAILGPLSVMFDGETGILLHSGYATDLMHQLASEIVTILQHMPEVDAQFSASFTAASLVDRATAVARATSTQLTSMLRQVRRGVHSEVDFVNGYLVQRGEELGLPCPLNRTMWTFVKARRNIVSKEADLYIPFAAQ